MGLKSGPNTRFRYVGKVASDVIVASVRERSRKPDQLYHIIEAMVSEFFIKIIDIICMFL